MTCEYDETDPITLATRERVAKIYRRDPAKKIAQVKKWQQENKERVNARVRERYHAKKRETELATTTP